MLRATRQHRDPETPGPAGIDHSRNTPRTARRREIGPGGGGRAGAVGRNTTVRVASVVNRYRPSAATISTEASAATRIAGHRCNNS